MRPHSPDLAPLLALLLACATLLTGCPAGSGGDAPPAGDGTSGAAVTVEDVTVPAGADRATLTAVLDRPATATVSVDYATADLSAVAGRDYVPAAGTLTFLPGDQAKHLHVELLRPEYTAALRFALRLSRPVSADIADGEGIATLTATALLEEADFDPRWSDVGVFSPAATCARCHTAADPVMTYAGEDVSPSTRWRHGLMANSFADPYFQAAVLEEATAFPALAGAIEDACLTCHAPMARTHAHQTGAGLDGEGHYRLETALAQMHAREGVSCTACHQIAGDGLGTEASFSGGYEISDLARLIFGPYPDPVTGPMGMWTRYVPVHASHLTRSALCATCHTLFTPTLDARSGEPTGEAFPEQTPYLEWRNSVYQSERSEPAECQDCHMPVPAEGYATRIATSPGGGMPGAGWPERSPFHVHGFPGGNTHTLTLLRDYRETLGIDGDTSVAGFDREIAVTRAFLRERTATIGIGPVTRDGRHLEIPVRIANRAGHKLPTSYPSRRVWVRLSVRDADGALVFESGRPDARGRLSIDAAALQPECLAIDKDDPGFDYARCYEPHRDRIDSPGQVAVYESVMGDTEGRTTYLLLQADRYLKDNRLPPRGFERAAVPADGTTSIIGAATHDPDFSPESGGGTGEDVVHYRVDPGSHPGPFTIEAALLYQAVRPAFVQALHADHDPRVSRYKQMVEAVPPTVETLDRASVRF